MVISAEPESGPLNRTTSALASFGMRAIVPSCSPGCSGTHNSIRKIRCVQRIFPPRRHLVEQDHIGAGIGRLVDDLGSIRVPGFHLAAQDLESGLVERGAGAPAYSGTISARFTISAIAATPIAHHR